MNSAENYQLDPKAILTPERFIEYEQSIVGSERVSSALDLIKHDGLKILDIGGASGVFLNELHKNSGRRLELFNLEVDDTYKSKQINSDIHFCNGSILNNEFKDDFFDMVTQRHILHHLIGTTLHETMRNQEKALEEMFRITKKGGYILVEEEVNNIKLFSRAVYFLSKVANKYKIKSKTFDAGTVIVSFMTPAEIDGIVKKNMPKYGLEAVKRDYVAWDMSLKWKLTLLMSRVGHVSWLLRKV